MYIPRECILLCNVFNHMYVHRSIHRDNLPYVELLYNTGYHMYLEQNNEINRSTPIIPIPVPKRSKRIVKQSLKEQTISKSQRPPADNKHTSRNH